MSKLLAALLFVVAGCATEVSPTALELSATGLGPCTQEWYVSCNYGIRIQGAGGYDHRGTFAWDQGKAPPGQIGHGPNGPVASTGLSGDIASTLPSGDWTISFRLWYGSDTIDLVPVPGGTPRAREEDPFTAACSTIIDTRGVARVDVHVAFHGSSCKIEALLDGSRHVTMPDAERMRIQALVLIAGHVDDVFGFGRERQRVTPAVNFGMVRRFLTGHRH